MRLGQLWPDACDPCPCLHTAHARQCARAQGHDAGAPAAPSISSLHLPQSLFVHGAPRESLSAIWARSLRPLPVSSPPSAWQGREQACKPNCR